MGRNGRKQEELEVQEDDVTVVRQRSQGGTERVRIHPRIAHRAVVHISAIGLPSRQIYLEEREHIIGRSAEVDISLLDESISRHHAKIVYQNEDFLLKDLDSKNGTFLNGTAVHECPLYSGDIIQVGNPSLRFLSESNHGPSGQP